jgi:hypothetical protein
MTDAFERAWREPGLHQCAGGPLRADSALADEYAYRIAGVGGSAPGDSRRVTQGNERPFSDTGPLLHAETSVPTIVSILGGTAS